MVDALISCAHFRNTEREEKKRQALLVFQEDVSPRRVANPPSRGLVDSGCEEALTSKDRADSMQLRKESTSLKTELLDRTFVPMEQCMQNLNI